MRIGNFPDKNDAGAFRNGGKENPANSVYVVEDIIDYIPKEAEDPSLNWETGVIMLIEKIKMLAQKYAGDLLK